MLTRALIVSGILGLVFTWQVDRGIRTAYSAEWVARGTSGLRVPTRNWQWGFPFVGFVAVTLLLGAVFLWRSREGRDRRQRPEPPAQAAPAEATVEGEPPPERAARHERRAETVRQTPRLEPRVTPFVLAGLTLVLALATAGFRAAAAHGAGAGWLTAATFCNAVALVCVIGIAIVTGNLVYEGLGGLRRVFREVLKRQRLNLLVVGALAAGLLFFGQTSGQSVDSIRSWSPLVLGSDNQLSGIGTARLMLGLAAALLFALALYESGTRLNQAEEGMKDQRTGLLLGIGAATTVLGAIVLALDLPLGPGLLIGGIFVLLVGFLDLPEEVDRNEPAADGSLTDTDTRSTPWTRAEENAPEWIAITPLLALAATSVLATAEAMLSAGIREPNSWLALLPAVVLGGLACLMTRRRPARPPGIGLFWSAAIGAAVVVVSLVLVTVAIWADDYAEGLMAGYGAVWFIGLVGYALWLFHRDPDRSPEAPELEIRPGSEDARSPSAATPGSRSGEPRRPRSMAIALGPFALGGGLAVFVAIHAQPLEAGQLLGVFTLALVALTFALPFLHLAVRTTLRLRPPSVLAWLGFNQLPVLALLLLWWIAVGFAQTELGRMSTLHDARLVERQIGGLEAPAVGRRASDLEQYFDEWVAAQPDMASGEPQREMPVPLVLVAAHGGGIRAAYWTVLALDCIVGHNAPGVTRDVLARKNEDLNAKAREAVCRGPRREVADQQRAAKRIFVASGVSGGAVGLYAYARQLLQHGSLGTPDQPDVDWVDDRLGGDFASPAIGWALFHDVPNRLFGLHPDTGAPCGGRLGRGSCLTQDRAAVLEETFDDAWQKADSSRAHLRRAYDLRSADDPEVRGNARLVPLLAMSSTLTGGRTRAVISAADLGSWPGADADDPERGNDRFPLAGTVEIRDALCETQDMRLSTAALLAARFPYVTPSGRIAGDCGYDGELRPRDREGTVRCAHREKSEPSCEGWYVDGGYTDNSGLFTLVALWPSLRALVVEHNNKAQARSQRRIAVMIVELDNHYQKSIQASVPSGGIDAETLIPPATAFGGRSAIETYARAAAYRILPDGCTFTVSPALHPGLVAPLGWELSEAARLDLRTGLTNPHPADPSGMKAAKLLRTVQSRLVAPRRPDRDDLVGADLGDCVLD